jgi:glyoxylase-like metal-dependent hydrolase (beta-lactamase superfamily II)
LQELLGFKNINQSQLLFRFPATQVDVVLGDEGFSLAEYGIPGRVIHTPGHTAGSVSVLLETFDDAIKTKDFIK